LKGEKKLNKKITTLSMILVLAITSLIGGISIANAQPPGPDKKTFAFVGLIPDTVGVGQEVLVHIGINTPTGGPEWGWEGLTATVTRPDGTTQTLGPYKTDATGGTGGSFTPTQVGTYTVQSHFPEQLVPFSYFNLENSIFYTAGTKFLASDSWVQELVVTEEPVEYYPGVPLPTEFWSRPVDQNFREWSAVTGNWYQRPPNEVIENNQPPETAHILWAKPYTVGGISGGDISGGMEDGDAYEGKFQSSVILNGVLFYRSYGDGFGMTFGGDDQGTTAVDLRTGETLWRSTEFTVDFASHLYFSGINYHGVYDYLWDTGGGAYRAYDPFTGSFAFGFTDVPSGNRFSGPSGEILMAVTNLGQVAPNGTVLRDGWVALWNMTASGLAGRSVNEAGSWERLFHGQMLNGSKPGSYSWNYTIPAGLSSPNLSGFFGGYNIVEDILVCASTSSDRSTLRLWAVGIGENNAGVMQFDKTWNTPSEWAEGAMTIHWTASTDYADGGVYVVWNKELRTHYGFSTDTGSYLWATAEPEHYLQIYGWGAVEHSWHIAYDKLYTTGVSGILYCYDVFTGDLLWTYVNEDPYSEYLFGNNFWNWISFISDGKIYMGHTEHSAIDPKPRGAPFLCLDAETGDVIWKADGLFRSTRWGGRGLLGDGIMATMDTYDQRIYAVGKGPSQTTVEAPKAGIPEGSSVVICGSVTDVSAGTASPEIAARFPNGVAAVADESMSDWMAYVYKQFPFPVPHVYGVGVSIDVIDSNGNFRNIGTAQTDANGFYSLDWMPDIPGKYTVIATFAGTGGYYASYAEAAFVVDEAPAPTPPPEATPAPMTDSYVLGMGAAAIIAIVIIGLLILLMLRKK
jgi:hypothetical protein